MYMHMTTNRPTVNESPAIINICVSSKDTLIIILCFLQVLELKPYYLNSVCNLAQR